MPAFTLANLEVPPGTKIKGSLGHVTLADGTRVGVPVVILNGVEDGPTLVVTASVHGTEVVGVGALLEVIRRTDPRQLRGRLVALTAANPFALQIGSYTTNYDGINLSGPHFWPANPSGKPTERIAALIAPAIQAATHLIDLHANPDPSIPFTLVNWALCRDEATRRATRMIAEAWGTTIIDMPKEAPTSLRDIGVVHGIPAITPELTGDGFLREDNVAVGRIGITNVMKAIGMLDGEPEPQPVKKLEGDFVFAGRLVTNAGGLMWVRLAPGQFARKGDVAVEMVDVWGDTVEQIRMPVDGYCWSYTGGIGKTHAVPEGTPVAYVFRRRDDG